MGSNFDCLDSSSHYYNRAISDIAKKNRHYLRRIMREAGFVPYAKEWWHFTLKYEPYPRRYFNFPVR
jgi:D-alanyl-D-alanine dipeptidase